MYFRISSYNIQLDFNYFIIIIVIYYNYCGYTFQGFNLHFKV